MIDRDPSLARVVFDLPRQDIPELMSHLGSFALEHDIALKVTEAPSDVESASFEQERLDFNPLLVTMFPDDTGENIIRVVTKGNLNNFAEANGLRKGLGERTINALGFSLRREYTTRTFKGMLHGSTSDQGDFSVIGIKVEHFRALTSLLDGGDLAVTNLGQLSINLLKAYSAELFPE